MKTWTPETLSERVCKRGHKGNWVIRGENFSVACRTCASEAVKRHRKNNPDRVKGLVKKTLPSIGQIENLKAYILELETQLEIAKKRLELSEEMVRLYNELRATKK